MTSETWLFDSFSTKQFLIDSYTSTYSLDRNCKGGGTLVYVLKKIYCQKQKLILEKINELFIVLIIHTVATSQD